MFNPAIGGIISGVFISAGARQRGWGAGLAGAAACIGGRGRETPAEGRAAVGSGARGGGGESPEEGEGWMLPGMEGGPPSPDEGLEKRGCGGEGTTHAEAGPSGRGGKEGIQIAYFVGFF